MTILPTAQPVTALVAGASESKPLFGRTSQIHINEHITRRQQLIVPMSIGIDQNRPVALGKLFKLPGLPIKEARRNMSVLVLTLGPALYPS